MKLKFLFVLLFLVGQVIAQDTLTVVAVGEAETEQDKIYFNSKLKKDGLNAKQLSQIEVIKEVIKSDFEFYRSLFEVQTTKSNETRYLVDLDLEKNQTSFKVAIAIEDSTEKKQILKKSIDVNLDETRKSGHMISDAVYQGITGKKSIFLTQIYFVSDRTSVGKDMRKELYVMDFDGENKKRLTFLNTFVISPSLSYDNSKIVYTVIENKLKKTARNDGSYHNVKNLNLHMMDLSTRKSKLVSSIDGINSGAVFNKSGDSLYMTLSYQKNADIFKMNLKTGAKTRITSHYSDDVDPYINRDETLMTFLSGRPGKANIYTLDPTGTEKSVKRISFVGDFNAAPRFNPDGTEIVFSSWVENRFDIFRIGSDGKNLVRLTKDFGSNEEPWYSPDGQFIVFTSQRVISRKRATQDVYIMDRDGEIIRKITSDYGKIFSPRWSNY